MLDNVGLKNFGPIEDVQWTGLGSVNLILGGNGCGKTFLLKALYCAIRTIEAYRRGDDQRTASEILADKLYWTFQPERIGDLVSKGGRSALHFSMDLDQKAFSYKFGRDTARQISSLENAVPARKSNSIFLPAKEVLSLHRIILKSRDQDKVFGFDDTYLDLARALLVAPTRGRNYAAFAHSRKALNEILGGNVAYDQDKQRWQFKIGNQTFPIGVTAEGVKKIAILDTLLGSRYLDNQSILFIDEPESALHPSAISKFMDIVIALAESGIQVFCASHSYFVVKKLFLIAQEKGISIPVLSASGKQWEADDLKAGMPQNAIIEESIRLYREEVGLALQ